MTHSPRSGAVAACALRLIATLPLLAGCSYVERAREGADLVVGVTERYKLEALVQADIERRRLRAARCLSPLLTPATISAAATDVRLGMPWVDGLLTDCPQFAAFLSNLALRRLRESGLNALAPQIEAKAAPAPAAAEEETGGSSEAVQP